MQLINGPIADFGCNFLAMQLMVKITVSSREEEECLRTGYSISFSFISQKYFCISKNLN